MTQPFNTNGMSLEELAALVQQQIATGKAEPKNDADKALKANHMDILHVHVPHQFKEYPKTLYKLKAATKKKPASVLTIDVADLASERAEVANGWETARIDVPTPVEDEIELEPSDVKRLLASTDDIGPVGRVAVKGKAPRGLQVTG